DAGIMHVVRLVARGRVRNQHAICQTIAIARASAEWGDHLEPAIERVRHWQYRAVFDRHADALLCRRPEPEPRLPVRQQGRTETRALREVRVHPGSSAYSNTALCAATCT